MDKRIFRPSAVRSWQDWTGPRVLAALVLLACLGLTAGLWRHADAAAEQKLQAAFDARVQELVRTIGARMQAYIQVLYGLQGLYASSSQVERGEFRRYAHAQRLETNVPGMRGFGYMQLVPRAELDAHVAAMRAAGFPDYAVQPAGERPLYAPIVYAEPPSPGAGQRTFGFDPYADPVRRAALEQARDTAEAAMSGKIRLLQDRPELIRYGFLIVLPVYDNRLPHDTLAQRRASLRGWVYAPFRCDDFMAGLGNEQAQRLDVEIYDGDGADPAQRMYDSAGDGVRAAALPLNSLRRMRIAGHPWTVVAGAHADFGQGMIDRPLLIAWSGLVASLALAALTWLLAGSRSKARAALRQAGVLTQQLQQGQAGMQAMADTAQRSQAMLRSILDATIDGILVDTFDGRILSVNRCFGALWHLPDLPGQDSAALFARVDALLEESAPFAAARRQALAGPGGQESRLVLRLKDGRVIEQVVRGLQLGLDPARLWSFRDITARHHAEQRESTRRQVLELLATGADLAVVLEAVVQGVEAGNPAMLCSILLLDDDGERIMVGAAPGLPAFFNAAVHGLRVGDSPGSCASALREGRRVIVEDIRSDPLWTPLRALAAEAQLESCWSEPIRGSAGKLLGSFAIYHRRPHAPSPANIALIEEAARLAGMAIEQARAAVALRVGEARFRSLYDNAPVALWQQDWSEVHTALALLELSGVDDLGSYLRLHPDETRRLAGLVRMLDVNAAALAQVGAEHAPGSASAARPAICALSLAQNFADSAMPAFALALTALAQGAHYFACESSFLRLDGSERHNELTLLVMPGHEQSLDFVIVSTVDITERKRMDADLLQLASTDFLTGLTNRREFMTRLEDQQARLQRGIDSAAVLMLDLDHFKTINDDHGHAAGDMVLRHVAALMRGCLRKIDTLGRVGGEEFAVLLPGADLAASCQFAERLRLCIAEAPLRLDDGAALLVTVSIGIALLSGADPGYDAALIRADQALYRAKRAGRNRVEVGARLPT